MIKRLFVSNANDSWVLFGSRPNALEQLEIFSSHPRLKHPSLKLQRSIFQELAVNQQLDSVIKQSAGHWVRHKQDLLRLKKEQQTSTLTCQRYLCHIIDSIMKLWMANWRSGGSFSSRSKHTFIVRNFWSEARIYAGSEKCFSAWQPKVHMYVHHWVHALNVQSRVGHVDSMCDLDADFRFRKNEIINLKENDVMYFCLCSVIHLEPIKAVLRRVGSLLKSCSDSFLRRIDLATLCRKLCIPALIALGHRKSDDRVPPLWKTNHKDKDLWTNSCRRPQDGEPVWKCNPRTFQGVAATPKPFTIQLKKKKKDDILSVVTKNTLSIWVLVLANPASLSPQHHNNS